jgi:DNA relaxase NicK
MKANTPSYFKGSYPYAKNQYRRKTKKQLKIDIGNEEVTLTKTIEPVTQHRPNTKKSLDNLQFILPQKKRREEKIIRLFTRFM